MALIFKMAAHKTIFAISPLFWVRFEKFQLILKAGEFLYVPVNVDNPKNRIVSRRSLNRYLR